MKREILDGGFFLNFEGNSRDCLDFRSGAKTRARHGERRDERRGMGDDRQSSGFQFSINHPETSAWGVNRRAAAVSGT